MLEGDPANKYDGVKGFFNWLERKKYKLHVRVFLSRYRGYATCPECGGTRLRAEARAVKITGKAITDLCKLTVKEARRFFAELQLTESQAKVADKILHEIRTRLQFLDEVGLDYLTLDRLTSTLSGGESQRIQLATSLGSHLVGALYVLDEPSIGLHPRDTQRLIDILKSLRDLGNTVLVVEHDPDTIESADRILDLGPGAGELGGKLLFSGTYEEILKDPRSITGRYLSGETKIPVPQTRHKPSGRFLRDVRRHVAQLEKPGPAMLPGTLTVITGVSGSGKSTLVHNVFVQLADHWKDGTYPAGWDNRPVTWVSLEDARAYAAWAGKRLPHEWEWQLAAQGTDGRVYPWGDAWQPANVPAPDQSRTMRGPDAVDAHASGASPSGVMDMVGNVWQWTDEFEDEHTRAAIVRGGSYYQPQGSIWYFPQGYRNDEHGKVLLMSPGYDRSGGIGFRCVKDASE